MGAVAVIRHMALTTMPMPNKAKFPKTWHRAIKMSQMVRNNNLNRPQTPLVRNHRKCQIKYINQSKIIG